MNTVQTVTQNSALSQNWIECIVHTRMAQSAHALRLGRAHAAGALRLGRAYSVVSQLALSLVTARLAGLQRHVVTYARCVVAPRSRYKNCIETQTSAARTARRVARAAARIAVLLHHIVGSWEPYHSRVACCVATQGPPPPRYKICVSTHPQRPGHARVLPLAPRACWSCRDAQLVVSCLVKCACTLTCHDTIHCNVTQTGKWVVAHLACLPCAEIFFFFLFLLIFQ